MSIINRLRAFINILQREVVVIIRFPPNRPTAYIPIGPTVSGKLQPHR